MENLYQLFLSSSGITTDTRKISQGKLFFALKGANFDGNSYADEAIKMGALNCVVDAPELKNKGFFWVPDVLKTLQDLAQYHRKQLPTKIIALTGSNGKTTTKELLATALSCSFKVAYTQGNLNNHIGVPLTLLSFTAKDEIGIVEMGANHQLEIAALCNIALPDFGLINNIGSAHLEGFGGLEGVRKGKTEMYQHLVAQEKIIFFNEQEPSLQISNPNKGKLVLYGNSQVKLMELTQNQQGAVKVVLTIDGEEISIASQLFGKYNGLNILTAMAIAWYFNVPSAQAKVAIEGYCPQNNRSQFSLSERYNNRLILDAYNANPNSMQAAIKHFADLTVAPKLVILGDMFELGVYTADEHELILSLLQELNLKAILVGKYFASFKQRANYQGFLFFEEVTSLKDYLSVNPIQHHHLLLKGSRGIALEQILTEL